MNYNMHRYTWVCQTQVYLNRVKVFPRAKLCDPDLQFLLESSWYDIFDLIKTLFLFTPVLLPVLLQCFPLFSSPREFLLSHFSETSLQSWGAVLETFVCQACQARGGIHFVLNFFSLSCRACPVPLFTDFCDIDIS